jgi:ribosome-associated toxin RatA of RatAB toxin-antitoxin module
MSRLPRPHSPRRRRLLGLIGLAWLAPVAHAQGEVRVSADVGFRGVRIEATSLVAADAETLWQTLTDYDRLASFIPDMVVSRLVSPPGQPKLVEQRADSGLFAFVMPDHVVLAMEERPLGVIRFRAVSGKVATMTGEWSISGQANPVRLTYRAHVVPLLPPPPLVSDRFIEAEVRQRFSAVVREAERRARARVAPP